MVLYNISNEKCVVKKNINMSLHRKHNKLQLFVALFVMATAVCGTTVAQNCDSLVQPKFATTPQVFDQLPQHKVQFYCNFAFNAFFWSDTLPQNAVVYEISEVSHKISGQNLSQNTVIERNTFSYYAYNFDDFQYRHYYQYICFKVGNGNPAKYLVLRDYNTIMNICMQLEEN